jgi:hypothetical protein
LLKNFFSNKQQISILSVFGGISKHVLEKTCAGGGFCHFCAVWPVACY